MGMMLDLTDEENLALIALLERVIRDDPFPLSPRVRVLKTIMDKLVEPPPGPEPLPPLKVYALPRAVLARRRRRG
jgi:hypothetical protein